MTWSLGFLVDWPRHRADSLERLTTAEGYDGAPILVPASVLSVSWLQVCLLASLLTFGACTAPDDAVDTDEPGGLAELSVHVSAFEAEIDDLRTALDVPGLAYVVVLDGETIASNAFGDLGLDTPLRIASVTKTFAAVVAMQRVESGELDLGAAAVGLVPELSATHGVPEEVTVEHLLTHTSEGEVGVEYVYGTNRYAMVADVVEAVTGQSFEEVVRQRVLEPAGMTVHESPHLGAHAGLVSTVNDMARYLSALDRGELLTAESMERLATPSRSAAGRVLPVSLGFFVQDVEVSEKAEQRVIWSFGQDDPDHSGALLVRLPEQKLSLFLLANSNVVSDPFRLLMGDVTKSPFAMSFVRLFGASEPGRPIPRPPRDADDLASKLAEIEPGEDYRFGDELVGWAMIDLWTGQADAARTKLDLAALRYGLFDEPDAVVHFAAVEHPDDAFKDRAIIMGRELLAEHPDNRWMLMAQGYLCMQRSAEEESLEEESLEEQSKAHFRHILDLPNQQEDFLRRLFRVWAWMALAEMSADEDPAQARAYLRQILDSGMQGEMVEEARSMLGGLDGLDGLDGLGGPDAGV